ncbi:DUF58 domain-containing protein [Fulvivirga sp. 29W222]|uniref:DUF58 domain-containing protein n=1 Tax=Fulvivirga marina TaxID=2494733 RepID=A0A937FWD7_9BACT|nr:DUF58 domain-containing protein [Fulvivirga marina]MBL6445566.1 DUF58 domain-containing protein [Fulvivirga marina]
MAIAKTALVAYMAVVIADVLMLHGKSVALTCSRSTSKLLSLGNDNEVELRIRNMSSIPLSIEIVDELPYQLQRRGFVKHTHLLPNEKNKTVYNIRPLVRGQYNFGKVHLFLTSVIGLVQRRISFNLEDNVAVYPSIIDMKKYELKAAVSITSNFGIKKIRRIGHSYEFEQIKEYTIGDDYKSMNWKATSRASKLMVNSYTDEKAQQVYCLIDKSRYMKMPFNGLSLLDYSVNSSLVIANTSLQKQDKAGLITFSDNMGSIIKADRGRSQLKKILEALYREEESRLDANYEKMYTVLRRTLRGRSLIFLFTNFESAHALERVLPVLRRINKLHLLVVVVFENKELINYYSAEKKTLKDIYYKTIAHKIASDREQITSELSRYGIQNIFTRPENLSINAINKYLELKSRGMI